MLHAIRESLSKMVTPIEISETMAYVGIDQIADDEMGASNASEFVRAVFCAMLSASGLSLVPDPKDVLPVEQSP